MRTVAKVFSIDFVSKGLLGGVGFVLIRYMPEVEFSSYTICLSIVALVSQFLTGAFDRIFVVGYEKFSIKDSVSSFLGLELFLVIFLFILFYPFANSSHSIYATLLCLTLCTCLFQFSKVIFQKNLNFKVFSLLEITRTLIFVFGVLYLITLRSGEFKATNIMWIQVFGLSLVSIPILWKKIEPYKIIQIRNNIKFGWFIFSGEYRFLIGFVILSSLFPQLNIFMLSKLADDHAVASYGSAYRYYSLLGMALAAVHVVLLPTVQKVNNRLELQNIYKRFSRLALLVTPAIILGSAAAIWIMPFIDGGKYPESVLAFQFLAASSILSFWLSPHITLLMKLEDFRFLFFTILICLILFIVMDYFIIPFFGPVGAAFSCLISYGVVNSSIFMRARFLLKNDFYFI